MKKVLASLLCLTMLVTLFCIFPTAQSQSGDSTYPTPTEFFAGPDTFKGKTSTNILHKAYVSKEDASAGAYNKYLVADFDISFKSFGIWASTFLWLDSPDCNDWGGFSFQISGPTSFASNAADFIENPEGVGIILKRQTKPGNEIIDAVALDTSIEDFVSTDYRIILKRVVGDTDTSVEFYMFQKGTEIPAEPMFAFSYINEEYGSPSTSVAFSTWELQKLVVSNMKLYDYNVRIQQNILSIDDPALVPTKTVAGPVTAEGVASSTVYFEPYVSKEEVETYATTLVADFNYQAQSFGNWTSTILWLDSRDFNDYGGFSFRIAGKGTFGNKDESVDNPDSVGVILRRSLGTGKGFENVDFASLNKNNSEFVSTEYRIISKRVIGDTETSFEFYMFEASTEIPAEPMFSYTYANEDYGTASTSVGFTTWENPKFTISNLKLYNYDINIEPYVPSINAPTLIATKTIAGPVSCVGEASKSVLHEAYVTKDDVTAGTYNEYLVADLNIDFSTFGGWRSAALWLDSYNCNEWGGFAFQIAGSSSFKSSATDFVDNPTGVGVVLWRQTKPGKEAIGAAELGVSDSEFVNTEYRIILKRVVGNTDTNVEFYMFEKDSSIPSEPMFSFSYTNEEYGSPSTSVCFSTWEAQEFEISNINLYNYNVNIESYVPYIGNEVEDDSSESETPEEDNFTVITRTSSSTETWLDTKEALDDYDYSMAVIGDTQYINRHYPEQFPAIYDWIIDNAQNKKIEFVMGLGDITDGDTTAEWELAQQQINRLDDVVPYSIVRGNHDGTVKYNEYFPYEKYAEQLGGSYDETMLNTWQELIIGETKYLIMSLDYGPDDDVLEWANEVIAAHPNHNVIITTHAYLYDDGTTLDVYETAAPTVNGGFNNGDHMWDKLIKKHENIVMVLCGHISSTDIVAVKTPGENGNVVTQMLIDPQGMDLPSSTESPTGMVCMLYFSEGGSKVQIEYYSTVKEKYLKDINQFTMDIAVVDNSVAGDINGDGGINAEDLTALRIKLINNNEYDTLYDVNEDGSFNLKDLVSLKKLCVTDNSATG